MKMQTNVQYIDCLLTELRSEFGIGKMTPLLEESDRWIKMNHPLSISSWMQSMINWVLSRINEQESYWTFVATRMALYERYAVIENQRSLTKTTTFARHVTALVDEGVYDPGLLGYTVKELDELEKVLDSSRDLLFTYIGLQMMNDYLILNIDKEPVELPQERWMIIAMTLMRNETERRLEKVMEAYWALSNFYTVLVSPQLLHLGKQNITINPTVPTTTHPVFHQDILYALESSDIGPVNELRIMIPDLFMEQVKTGGYWHLFDANEVRSKMGFSLEDYFDEKKGAGSFREKYEACVNGLLLTRSVIPAVDLMKQIMRRQLEQAGASVYFRDELYRNAADETRELEGVPNSPYASINLGRALSDDVLARVISIQVRMLDNAIDLVYDVTPSRGIQLGVTDWHHALALRKIRWESAEAVTFADELHEEIAYYAISASMAIATEKGAYASFQQSGWCTGAYFEKRGYHSSKWLSLRGSVAKNGMRNGHLLSIQSNVETSLLVGCTTGVEPILHKSGKWTFGNQTLRHVVPDLHSDTYWFYKSGYFIDPLWTIKQHAARQRHIDQITGLQVYVQNSIQASELLQLHLASWKSGLVTSGNIVVMPDFPFFLNIV